MNQVCVKPIRVVDTDPGTRQEVDLNFLGSGYRRRVYVSSDPGFHWKESPRRSRTSLTFVPIPVGGEGFGSLVYLDCEGNKQTVEMSLGNYYYIPPQVPFQIETRGSGVLEVYAPKPDTGRWFDMEPLPEDFFDQDRSNGS